MGVWVKGSRVQGPRSRVQGLGFGVQVWGLGLGLVWVFIKSLSGFRVQDFGFRVKGFGVWGFGFWVQGSRVLGFTSSKFGSLGVWV